MPGCLLSTSTSVRSGRQETMRARPSSVPVLAGHSCRDGGVWSSTWAVSPTGLTRNCPAFTCASASATDTRLTNMTRDSAFRLSR